MREYLNLISSGQNDIGESFWDCVHVTKHNSSCGKFTFFLVILMPSFGENSGCCVALKLFVKKLSTCKVLYYPMKSFMLLSEYLSKLYV